MSVMLAPAPLIESVRRAVKSGSGPDLVAAALRLNLPSTGILSADQLRGDPSGYQTHLIHAEAAFSIAAMVWLPGQRTPVHDHVSWCVTAVLQGTEYEEIFDASLRVVARNLNPVGTVSGFAPPGDIHRVTNSGTGVAVSMHVYGVDLTRRGSSIRREYTLPTA
jgi:predicted metal-dependent enzyme (double-stranded beta helix superfamily)